MGISCDNVYMYMIGHNKSTGHEEIFMGKFTMIKIITVYISLYIYFYHCINLIYNNHFTN